MMSGFWGNRTATIDWCENNYEITHYIAEFWNTISNLGLILFPLYGIYWSLQHISYSNKYSTKHKKYFKIPTSLLFCHIGLSLVGIGSWMFHMTLLYPMQLLDELPMIFGTGILIYANYETILSIYNFKKKQRGHGDEKKTNLEKIFSMRPLIMLLITIYCVGVAYIYLYIWKNPVFHEFAFALMTICVISENVTLIRMLNLKKRMYVLSFVYYMFGFLLWNIDNKFCSYLKLYRQNLESFFGLNQELIQASSLRPILLNLFVVSLKSISEFHSLWHVFTGYGSFMVLLFLTEVHYQFYLIKTNAIKKSNEKKDYKAIGSKFYNMYYHFSNSIIVNEKKN
ncbi:unnamed protein product [Brachionus calyciflorus]|uniref:Alkaline ceramidase n=1 Tax=Brachionus calyciflorus TaxID=104777 RepID=A0A813PLC3_9BILA|nr:unnamed protein product [Brachionus calyciflorus]